MAELLFNTASPPCVREFMSKIGNYAKTIDLELKIQHFTMEIAIK